MFRLIVAVVLLWALMTSGVSVLEVAGTLLSWAAEHVHITIR